MDIEQAIRMFAKAKRVKLHEFPAFRQRILDGLVKMGLPKDSIDLEAYKKKAKEAVK
jgi:hypothetical protein